MIGTNWFQRKWGLEDPILIDELYSRVVELEAKCNSLILDIKKLEEENIETSNLLYEIMNSIDAVDRRIDIVAENSWKEKFE